MNQKLIQWSEKNYHDLPWRKNRSLYTTLVSEIMLQQTTVATVLKKFNSFILKYPTIQSLAEISEEEMLRAWEGLGYYRRARNLLSAAQEITLNYAGEIPLDFNQLIAIKGIGEYTANALLAIGANKKALALDANLERVIARYYHLTSFKGPLLQKDIYQKFQNGEICQNIHELGPRQMNEALMDLGRVICKANTAACEICPLQRSCMASRLDPLSLPLKKSSPDKEKHVLHLLRVIVIKGDKFACYQKADHQWLAGQFELPTFTLHSTDQNFSQYPELKNAEDLTYLPYVQTAITKYKIYNHILLADQEELGFLTKPLKFFDLGDIHLSTASQKCINFLLKKP
ncbi:MAG: hypothetical protein CME62_15735 [Halobacteriovoraceae bacterium]|nr:hypothetical protein [Halobacteriovoraceae bacterium]